MRNNFHCKLLVIVILTRMVMMVQGQEDKCPRPDEIAPCQCRTRGPSIQVRCVNSMLGRVMEAMINIRKKVDVVDVLILENNNIPHLPSRAFGSVKVNRLFLENNRIQTIDRNAFAGVENYLTEIFIKEPELKQLPRDSIDFLKQLTIFSIDSSQISEMPTVVGLPNLKLFKIDGSNITDIPSHSLKSLPGLRYLHVANGHLRRLDVGLLENLPYLVLANFTGNEISWIHPRAFRYMEQMEELVLSGNSIRDAVMVGQAVKVIKTIKKLDLSGNEIDKVRDDSFMDIISLEELNLSGNKLSLLQRDAFHRLPRLRKVDLSRNEIRTFHSEAFSDTPLVEELLLSTNQITRVTDVSFMIDSLPYLRFLDLSQNLLGDIPYGAMRGYPALEKLYLADNQIAELSQDAFQDLPSLTELILSKNKLTSRSIDGQVFNLPNLKTLDVSFNKLSKISRRLLDSLSSLKRLDLAVNSIVDIEDNSLQMTRNIEYLNISYNSLREVSPQMFRGLDKLFELDLSHNELVTLSDDTFADQRELEFVNLSNNQIQLVSSSLFPVSNRIRFLDFSANFITNFPSGMIKRLRQLTRLVIRRNSIQSLNRDAFEGLNNLELVDLHDNRIEDIDNRAFRDLLSLKSLDLSLNVISTVGTSLEPLKNLMKLNLSDNYITTLPFTAFRSLNRLSTLDISNNTIVDIGEAFVDMPELKFLDLSYNHLPSIKTGAFRRMPKLLALHLDHNSIISIAPDAFQELWDLERLHLTKNGISIIETDTFRRLPSLEKLYLDDNLIKELEERSFQSLLSLKELHLEYNLIKNINERAFHQIPSIRFLNLSYNLLQDLSRYGFYGLETLETIDLSFNDVRIVDDRVFDNLKWLVFLYLNDNNICNIASRAFKDATSLRKLDLKNNRIYRLEESAFTNIQRNIDSFHISGNPLNCDCQTKWLRNWVSSQPHQTTRNNYEEEPRCYFPKSLSGNPLRQLRSSRFVCDPRDASFISDACNAMPLKTPAQIHMHAVTDTGIPENLAAFNIQFGGPTTTINEIETTPISRPLQEDETNKIVDLVNEVIDSELDVGTTEADIDNDGEPDYQYEYVYYYYDENGVNGTLIDVKPANSLTKFQNISAVNIHTNSGDTPTIYAGASNVSENIEKVDDPTINDGGGMSIFGIPIPTIPISLSFGLAPAISQVFSNGGLIPIGRKGEAAKEKFAIEETDDDLLTDDDQTRGPDTQTPVWVDKFKNIDFKKLASLFPDSFPSKKKTETEETNKVKRKSNYNNYLEPKNPIIPLSGSKELFGAAPGSYFPQDAKSSAGGYFPVGSSEEQNIPIIKFDHPIHPILPPDEPVLPPNSPVAGSGNTREYNFYQQILNEKLSTVSQNDLQKIGGGGGFQPMFIPANKDGNMGSVQVNTPTAGLPPLSDELLNLLKQQGSKTKRPAFPGIDATIRNEATGATETPRVDIQTPSIVIEEVPPYSNDYNYNYYDNKSPYAYIPEYANENDFDILPDDTFFSRSTEKPASIKPKRTPDILDFGDITTNVLDYKERVKETTTEYDPRKRNRNKQEAVNFVQTLLNEKNNIDEDEIRTEPPPSTEMDIDLDILHKGTPVHEQTTDDSQEDESQTNTPQYEYEYEYVYYDDYLPITTTESSTIWNNLEEEEAKTTTSKTSLKSLLNFLNRESTTFQDAVPSPTIQATLRPAIIRSSTIQYDMGDSYPELQRSTVTVEIEDKWSSRSRSSTQSNRGPTARSSSSSPYPFHPDRLDPASPPNSAESYDNSVNWYYSSYNNENTVDPYVGPRHERTSGDGLRVGLRSDADTATFATFILPSIVVILNLL